MNLRKSKSLAFLSLLVEAANFLNRLNSQCGFHVCLPLFCCGQGGAFVLPTLLR